MDKQNKKRNTLCSELKTTEAMPLEANQKVYGDALKRR